MKPNIYLDIDGVLLTSNLQLANHAAEFIRYVLANYPDTTYWLTTHCQGDTAVPINDIGYLFDEDTQKLLWQIKPTTWDTAKTRTIDFTKPFLWFDDNLFYEERETLTKHNVLDNWILADLAKDPDQLLKFIHDFPLPVDDTQSVINFS